MSAPKQGRQSPDPETQDPKQGTASQSNPNDQGAAPSGSKSEDKSKDQLSGMASNPKDVMGQKADEKTTKGAGNDVQGGK